MSRATPTLLARTPAAPLPAVGVAGSACRVRRVGVEGGDVRWLPDRS